MRRPRCRAPRRRFKILVSAKSPEHFAMSLRHICQRQPKLRADALRGLAAFDDEHGPEAILGVYGELTPAERRDALATLSSRPAYAAALLDAVAGGKVPANHLTADLVTNLRNLNDGRSTSGSSRSGASSAARPRTRRS